MREESTTSFKLDPENLPKLEASAKARLAAMSDDEIQTAAASDKENPPVQMKQVERFRRAVNVKTIRKKLALTQEEFAKTFHLGLATLRDWEQERYQPDQAARTLLKVISKDPESVKRALAS